MNEYPLARYQIWLCNQFGTRLTLIDNYLEVSFAKRVGSIGRFTLTVPYIKANNGLYRQDNTVQIFRTPYQGFSRLVYAGFVRGIRYREHDKSDVVVLSGEDGISILKSRIVAYKSGSAQAAKTDYIDNIMKQIVREAMISAGTGRNLGQAGVVVDANTSASISISAKFAWRNVLDVLNGLTERSIAEGVPIYFDMIPTLTATSMGWRFSTFPNFIGADRSHRSKTPTIFSKEFGNLENPELDYNFSDERNYAYVGGEGEGAQREVAEAENTLRTGVSVWNRREIFVNYSNQESASALISKATQAVREGLSQIKFTATLKDSLQTRYGVDWKFGDKVTARYLDNSLDGVITAISISLDKRKEERIDARMEVNL